MFESWLFLPLRSLWWATLCRVGVHWWGRWWYGVRDNTVRDRWCRMCNKWDIEWERERTDA